jgi:SAM-dependent methyltransferase
MEYILFFLALIMLSVALASAAPFVPTKKKDIGRFLALAEIKAGERVYDLGCGDGRILAAAASRGAKAIGLELSILNYWFCRIFRRDIEMRFKNFFTTDFSDADLVYMFLSPKAHNKIGGILKKQMKTGSRIITYVWPIAGMAPEKINKSPGRPDLYLFRN